MRTANIETIFPKSQVAFEIANVQSGLGMRSWHLTQDRSLSSVATGKL